MSNPITAIAQAIIAPIAGAYSSRQARKQAVATAQIKLKEGIAQGNKELQFNDQEWEALAKVAEASSWKDEYVTLSVVSILNLIVLGGILQAFGWGQVLGGIAIAIEALVGAGVDVGLLMEAVIYSAVGLSIWRKI